MQEPVLQARAFDLNIVSELETTLEGRAAMPVDSQSRFHLK